MEKKKKGNIWKPISIGSTSAVALVLGSSLLDAGDAPQQTSEAEAFTPQDEASFRQAFAEARQQKGPQGSFVWRERQYATATREEWDSMTEVQQNEIAEQASEPSVDVTPEVVEMAEEAVVPDEVDVSDGLDVSVVDEDVELPDVAMAPEPADEPLVVTVDVPDEDDFGDDEVRVIGMDTNIVDEDSYASLGDSDQDVYVINLDDVDVPEDEDVLSADLQGTEIDVDANQHIDISTVVDYEEPRPEEDGLMGESLDSYFA